MKTGGQVAIRGYLVQTLIAMLDVLNGERAWESVTLEPNVESDKVDILWKYSDSTKAVQVKSSRNPFCKADITRWAAELKLWREADEHELVLVGTPGSPSVAKIRNVDSVSVPAPKNLDLDAFKDQAAHRLDRLLRKIGLDPGDAGYREMLVGALAEKLATLSTGGRELTHSGLLDLLTGWIPPAVEERAACAHTSNTVRIIRVFVSAPDNVNAERAELDEICSSINRTEGRARGVRLELSPGQWDGVPQIGPGRERVLEKQRSRYDIYLGIMSTRFGEPAGRYGSGTERELNEALKSWKKAGRPWITFYFKDHPSLSSDPTEVEEYLKVCQFRKKLESLGLVGSYRDVRGAKDAFYETVSEHFRTIIGLMLDREEKAHKRKRKSTVLKKTGDAQSGQKTDAAPIVPPEYIEWLQGQCGEMDLMGMQVKHGAGIRLNQIYTPLVTSMRSERQALSTAKPTDELLVRHEKEVRLLLDLFDTESLYVSGDPGSGKSTSCRWVTWLVCNGALPDQQLSRANHPRGVLQFNANQVLSCLFLSLCFMWLISSLGSSGRKSSNYCSLPLREPFESPRPSSVTQDTFSTLKR